jgi:hypothetical protein
MWSPPLYGTAYQAATPIQIRQRTGEGALATEKLYSDVATNARGAHICLKFKDATADIGKWHDGAYAYAVDDKAIVLDYSVGTVIDLHFSVQLSVVASSAIALTTSSSSTGTICWNYLDSVSTSGTAGLNYLTPVNVLGTVALGY